MQESWWQMLVVFSNLSQTILHHTTISCPSIWGQKAGTSANAYCDQHLFDSVLKVARLVEM